MGYKTVLKKLNRHNVLLMIRYLLVAVIAYAIDLGGFVLLLKLGCMPLVANVLVKIAAAIFGFFGHRFYTYKIRKNDDIGEHASKYFLLTLLYTPISTLCLYLIMFAIHNAIYAKVIVDILLFILTFWVTSTFTFKTKPNKEETNEIIESILSRKQKALRLAITGATGYIGQRCLKHARENMHSVLCMSRQPNVITLNDWMQYDLMDQKVPSIPAAVDIVVHLATSKEILRNPSGYLSEIRAAELLLAAAQNVGAKILFISSQTASSSAITRYGQTKWEVEKKILAAGGVVIRPGQVYGGKLEGLFGQITQLVDRLLILPAFIPTAKIQPVHVDDLAIGILKVVENMDVFSGQIISIGSEEPVSFTKFLHAIAKYRLKSKRLFIPIPVFILLFLARFTKSPSLQRLHSLFTLPPMSTGQDLQKLALKLRPLSIGMSNKRRNTRRVLLLEGRALFQYLLQLEPNHFILRRYVRAIEALYGGHVLHLPALFIFSPRLITLLDGVKINNTWQLTFFKYLDFAMLIVEATPLGAKKFLGVSQKNNFIINSLGIIHAIFLELGWRVLSIICYPLLKWMLPKTRKVIK